MESKRSEFLPPEEMEWDWNKTAESSPPEEMGED